MKLEIHEPGYRPGATHEPVSESELTTLPPVVRHYLRFMGVPGRLRDRSFRMSWKGRFRTGPDAPWRRCRAWQYNASPAIARYFRMKLELPGPFALRAQDVYEGGRGRMRASVLGVVPVVDASGPELDLGELVTWLDDAILFAPSMLLRPQVAWTPVSEGAFDVALTDAGQTVRARVFVDGLGAPREVSTNDRFVRDLRAKGRPWVRARWTTPVDGWCVVESRRRPIAGRAIWHLPRYSFAYAEADFGAAELQYNVPPED